MFEIDVRFDKRDLGKLDRILRDLGPRVSKRHLRAANKHAFGPMVKDAKRRAPVRSGLLKKSVGQRTRSFRGGQITYTALGPRTGFKAMITDTETGRQILADPTKYAWVVEHGSQYAGAQPFMRPAFEEHKHSALQRWMTRMWKGVDKEAKKLR